MLETHAKKPEVKKPEEKKPEKHSHSGSLIKVVKVNYVPDPEGQKIYDTAFAKATEDNHKDYECNYIACAELEKSGYVRLDTGQYVKEIDKTAPKKEKE